MQGTPKPIPWPRIVADCKRALSVGGRKQLGLFAIEGFRLLQRALSSGTPLAHTLIGETDHKAPSPQLQLLLQELASRNYPVTCVPDDVLAMLTEGRTFGSVLALAKIPPPPCLEPLLEGWKKESGRKKLLVLESMMDPGNVGALLRTAHALGVDAVVALRGADPFHPRAARTSMGSIFRVPVIRLESTQHLLQTLRENHVLTVGAATEAATLLPDATFGRKDVALFVGNEGKGLSPQLRGALDQLVAIPMSSAIDSFSVNAATAVILYAITHTAPPQVPLPS
jgi:RNA methyltransferase, TrmH family